MIPLTTYNDIIEHDAVSQVAGCRMPLLDAGQPTLDERRVILEWAACDQPNN
jgi:hypothetical protein